MKKTNQSGFISLTLVIMIMSLLLAFSFTQSIEIGHFFDMTRTKEYRLMNYYNAQSCIDQAMLSLAHDYFFTIDTPKELRDFNCVIDEIVVENEFRIIKVYGNYMNMNVPMEARVKMFDDQLLLIN